MTDAAGVEGDAAVGIGPAPGATGGVAEEGRDHPGPVVVEDAGVAVNFAVTSFE